MKPVSRDSYDGVRIRFYQPDATMVQATAWRLVYLYEAYHKTEFCTWILEREAFTPSLPSLEAQDSEGRQ